MHVTVACVCGAVTFSAELESVKTMVCHCSDCQVLGSTAFRIGALVPEDTFKIAGATQEYRRVALGAASAGHCASDTARHRAPGSGFWANHQSSFE